MINLFSYITELLIGAGPPEITKPRPVKKLTDRQLIKLESEIGRTLFGHLPEGHSREFFCLDEHTWVWYEQWIENGLQQSRTTRYEVHPKGILKVEDGGKSYNFLKGEELANLAQAAVVYKDQVRHDIYASNIDMDQLSAKVPDIIQPISA